MLANMRNKAREEVQQPQPQRDAQANNSTVGVEPTAPAVLCSRLSSPQFRGQQARTQQGQATQQLNHAHGHVSGVPCGSLQQVESGSTTGRDERSNLGGGGSAHDLNSEGPKLRVQTTDAENGLEANYARHVIKMRLDYKKRNKKDDSRALQHEIQTLNPNLFH